MATPDIAKLDVSDSDNEDLFASPSRPSRTAQKSENRNGPAMRESKYDTEQAREEALRKELENVRSINEVIEGVVSSLETAKGNMDVSYILWNFVQIPLLHSHGINAQNRQFHEQLRLHLHF